MIALDPSKHSWMTAEPTRAVLAALRAGDSSARFVGGAVRNALLGEPVTDVDIATPLRPEDVIRRLTEAGLGAVPTGIEHGTVTAVSSGKTFEVTTLRRDIATDGRRAVVAYTKDWKEDAARRDFTMNALYADEDGTVYDYFDGLADLQARRIRFVGEPRQRIREDYLRILRLFRFHAWYGRGAIDAAALQASVTEKAGLKTLSGERVQKEMLRLLEAKNPLPSLLAMEQAGILTEILPTGTQLDRLARLVAIGEASGIVADPILRLAALLSDSPDTARALSAKLRLSNVDRDRLVDVSARDQRIGAGLTERDARRLIYRLGSRRFRDQLLLAWADAGADGRDELWRALLSQVVSWHPPDFPLDGRDAMAAGVPEGPKIGTLLREIEEEWIAADFVPDRAALLARLREAAAEPRQ